MKNFISRKITREYNEIILNGAEVGWNWEFKIEANNAEKANDYLVKAMTWKSQEEIDELDQKEFDILLIEINKIKAKKK